MEKLKIEMEIARKDGKTIFKFKVPSKITEIYKEQSTEVRESVGWKGLKFFFIPEMLEDEMYQSKLRRHMLMDDFGTGLYKNGYLNIAWLRAESGEGEIAVADSLSFADLSILIKNCTGFIKTHFEEKYTDFKISGSISLEI